MWGEPQPTQKKKKKIKLKNQNCLKWQELWSKNQIFVAPYNDVADDVDDDVDDDIDDNVDDDDAGSCFFGWGRFRVLACADT